MVNTRGSLWVLHVFGSLARGGAETWLMDIMRNTTRERIKIDVCVISDSKTKEAYEKEFEELGGRILRCVYKGTPRHGWSRRLVQLKNMWNFSRRFKQLLHSERYNIVHCHLYYLCGLILRSAARAGVPKRITHIHPAEDLKAGKFSHDIYAWWMKRWIQCYSTGIVGPSKASLEGFWGPDWQKDPNKHVIYNGICVGRFARPVDRAKVRYELGIPENSLIVLNVSRFWPHKRHEFLVQVAKSVLAQRQGVYFLLVGRGELKQRIEKLVAAERLEKNFRFISGAPSIDPYFMAADVFAFPSCNEGFGISIIEAAAAGLKVIAQDIPGVREAATACSDPILLPLDTPADKWAQTLLYFLKQPRMPESQRQILLKQFPFKIETSISKLMEIYGVQSAGIKVNPRYG